MTRAQVLCQIIYGALCAAIIAAFVAWCFWMLSSDDALMPPVTITTTATPLAVYAPGALVWVRLPGKPKPVPGVVCGPAHGQAGAHVVRLATGADSFVVASGEFLARRTAGGMRP